MSDGQILVAEQSGVNVIKMVGDVRLTLCISFDNFIDKMFNHKDFVSVIFDLREAQGVDSTTLGLMAKISIYAHSLNYEKPLVIVRDASMIRLLESMGFEDIFKLINDENALTGLDPIVLDKIPSSETDIKNKVLEAHQILMSLNESNKLTFKELVETLENDI